MASLGFDPGDPNKWYQSPHLGLIPTGYGGEIAYNCSYYSTVGASYQRATHFTQPNHYPPPQHNYYTPPPPNFTQPHSYPPSHHFTPPNPYPPPLHFAQPNSYSPPPQSSHSGTLINGHWLPLQFSCASQSQAQYYPSPHLQPTHSISPQPSPQRPSIPCYYTPHPNPNLQIHPSISPTSSHEPMVVHSHQWRACCKQVALESTAATGGVKKPRHKRKELLMRKPLFQRLLGEITQGFKTELRLHSSGFEQPKTMGKPHGSGKFETLQQSSIPKVTPVSGMASSLAVLSYNGKLQRKSVYTGCTTPHHEDIIGFPCEMGTTPVTFANSTISSDVILDLNTPGHGVVSKGRSVDGNVCMTHKLNIGSKSMNVSKGSVESSIHSTKMPIITREVIGSLQEVKEFNVIKSATAKQDEMTSEYVRADEVEPPDKEHNDGFNGKENVVDIGVNGNQDTMKNYGTAENKLVRSLHAKMEQQISMTDELCKEQLDSVYQYCKLGQFREAKKSFLSTWLFGDKYGTGDDGVMFVFTSAMGSAPIAFALSTLSTAAFGCNYNVSSKHPELALNGLWDDSGGLPTMKVTVKSLCESCLVLEDCELIHKADHMISDHKHSAIMLALSHLLLSEENFSEVTILHSRLEALLLCHFDVSAIMTPLGVANFNMSLTNWKVRLKVPISSSEGNFDYDLHVASLVESMRIDAQNIFVYMQVALSARHCFELLLSILNIDIVTVMPSFSHAWGFRVDHLGPPLPTSGHFELHLVQELLAFQRCFLLVTMGSKRSIIVFVGRICQQLLQPHMCLFIFTADSTKWTSFHTAVNKYCTGEMLTWFQAHDLPLLLLMSWFIHFCELGNSETAKTQPPSCRKALAELNQIIHLMVSQIFISRNPQYFRAASVGVWCYLVNLYVVIYIAFSDTLLHDDLLGILVRNAKISYVYTYMLATLLLWNVSREQLRSTASVMDTIAVALCGKRMYSIEIYVWMGSVGISILFCLLTCPSTTFRREAAREIESLAYRITHHSRYWYVTDVLMYEEGFIIEFFDKPQVKKLDSWVAATTIWFTDDLNTRETTFLTIVHFSDLNITIMIYLLQANFSKPHDFGTTVVPHAIYRSIRVKDDMVSCCCEDIATNWLSQFSVVQFCILSEDAQILGCLVINGVSNTRMLVDFLLLLRSSFGSLDLQLAAELVMCGDARDACSMIGGNSMIDLVLWTAVIVGYYMHNGYSLEALELYLDKGWVGLLQHSITPPRVRLACAQSGNLCMGRSVHRCGIKLGLTVSNVSNLLVDLHAKCHIIRDARYIFVTTWDKHVLPWSSGSFGYSLNGFAYEALHLCLRMRSQSFQLAAFTLVRFLSACASCGFLLVYEESCFHGYVAMPNGKQLKAKTCDASLDGALGAPARTQAQLLNDVVQASHTWLLTSLIPCALLLSIMQVISTIAAALTQLTSEVPRHLNAKTLTHTAAQIVSPEMYHFA